MDQYVDILNNTIFKSDYSSDTSSDYEQSGNYEHNGKSDAGSSFETKSNMFSDMNVSTKYRKHVYRNANEIYDENEIPEYSKAKEPASILSLITPEALTGASMHKLIAGDTYGETKPDIKDNVNSTTSTSTSTSSTSTSSPRMSDTIQTASIPSTSTDWNVRSTFRRDYKLTDAQLGVVYNALKHGSRNLKVYETIDDTSSTAYTNEETIYGINELNFEPETLHTHLFKVDEDLPEVIDPMLVVYDYVNEGKILLIQNQYRAKIFLELEKEKSTSSNILNPRLNEIGYILTKIRNGRISVQPKDKRDLLRLADLSSYAMMIAYKLKHGRYNHYICDSSKTDYNSPKIKDKFHIVLVPKDLQHKFTKPGKYFDELKAILKLNPENGFYSYSVDNTLLPVLCTHEYMIYEGRPLSEVSIQCYKKGKCKYCGQELNAYHEQVKDNLPPKIYDLIYKYMDTINENIEVSSLMFVLFSLIYDSIKTNVDNADVKNYDSTVVAFAGLYLYVVYMKTKTAINYNNKINKFLDSVKKYWAEVGWTSNMIDSATTNTSMFTNMSNITELIREKIYTNDIKFLDLLPASILFGVNVDPKDYDKLEAKTEMQKMWKDGVDKVKQFNELFEKTLLKFWKFDRIKDKVNDIGKEKINTEFSLFDIKKSDVKNGEKFFFTTCGTYCPVSSFHSWGAGGSSGSGNVCSYCGLKKDLSNKQEVYNKYQLEINSSYLQKPKVLPDDHFKIDKLYSKDQIEGYKADDLFEKFLNIQNHMIKQAINKAIDDNLYIDETLLFISTMTTISVANLDNKPEFVKKALCFIIDKKIKSDVEVLNELKNIYFKINNIDWLLLQSK